MSSNEVSDDERTGCGWWLVLWFAAEIVTWIVIAAVGEKASIWALVVSAVISAVFFMVYGSIRVLRGHDL